MCKNKGWDEGDRFSGRELKGSTVGIVALGNAVAEMLLHYYHRLTVKLLDDPFIDTQKGNLRINTM